MDKPDGGTLRIDGEETSGLNEAGLTKIRARKIGFVFQQFFLLPTLTAQENVQLPAVFQHNGDRAELGAEWPKLGETVTFQGAVYRITRVSDYAQFPMLALVVEPEDCSTG